MEPTRKSKSHTCTCTKTSSEVLVQRDPAAMSGRSRVDVEGISREEKIASEKCRDTRPENRSQKYSKGEIEALDVLKQRVI